MAHHELDAARREAADALVREAEAAEEAAEKVGARDRTIQALTEQVQTLIVEKIHRVRAGGLPAARTSTPAPAPAGQLVRNGATLTILLQVLLILLYYYEATSQSRAPPRPRAIFPLGTQWRGILPR